MLDIITWLSIILWITLEPLCDLVDRVRLRWCKYKAPPKSTCSLHGNVYLISEYTNSSVTLIDINDSSYYNVRYESCDYLLLMGARL